MDVIKLYIRSIDTRYECDRSARLVIKRACRAKPKGYQFMPSYREQRWDGFIGLSTTSTLPTGLLGIVVPILRQEGYTVEMDWIDPNPAIQSIIINSSILSGIILRDYQTEAVQIMLRAGRGIAKMATNSGKTEVMAAMLYYIAAPSLVIVSGKDLLYQTAVRLQERLGRDIALVGAGNRDVGVITVATVQTIARMDVEELHYMFGDIHAVFIDECHHGSSATYLETLNKLPACMRFGFSGTPLDRSALDDLRLMSITGRQLVDVTNDELIVAGHSAKPVVELHTIESSDDKLWWARYQDAYSDLIVGNVWRNALIARIAVRSSGVVLIIVSRIAHGNALHELIDGSVFVNGKSTDGIRKQVLEDMRTVDGVYIATVIFDEGVDVPNIGTLINAAGGKSARQLLQRVGRGLRKKKEGENVVYVHDFIDDTNKHLLDHSESRVDVYVAEGFEIKEQADIGDIV